MALTESTMLDLGTMAPDFALPDANGEIYKLDDFAGAQALLVAFICNHCPYVKHIKAEFAELARAYEDAGLATVAINSNDIKQYPDDSPENMKRDTAIFGYRFPYLVDESQAVAKAYGAACTPDFFLFDGERKLVYRGQFDSSRPGNNEPVTGEDLKAAIDAVLAGEDVAADQVPSIGCNIKWKPGNAPDYAG